MSAQVPMSTVLKHRFTQDSQAKFGKNIPSIETVSLGNDTKHGTAFKTLTTNNRKRTLPVLTVKLLKIMESTLEEVWPLLLTEAAYIDSDDLYTRALSNLDTSFFERFHDKVLLPVKVHLSTYTLVKEQRRRQLALGIKDPVFPHQKRWKDSIKLFNTAFGFESARPLGPLVELVGPIIPKSTCSRLTQDLDNFLFCHQRVAYIAFGQHATTNEAELTVLLAGLLETYEMGDIDGMIWSTRGLDGIIPSVIVTRSNATYDIHQLLNQEKPSDIAFIQWAPQTAILQHPSTILFVTHAGAGSLYEGLQAGKRLVFYPFFGDQPRNTQLAEKFGLGLAVDYKGTRNDATQVIQRVARDEDGFFQSSVNRFQALVQIKSQSGTIHGANLVE
ncbi:hypothetical protein MAM1_0010c01085 [Mucor ambiguus]|uniref:Uncharacterized protein n=1 Tax=Mucor ambiguus TaxID=91626 RepID=A0A0C9M0K0_9FUNG|nr:hypothetical protein MAM1_0010c01085 [Mucor ambiguus]